jgi:hypothetical protein
MSSKPIPPEVRHEWRNPTELELHSLELPDLDTKICANCAAWLCEVTQHLANWPCPARDRRKGPRDRRKGES